MVACESVSIKVTDSVVGKVPGTGNAAGGSSSGPDPCGSGGSKLRVERRGDAEKRNQHQPTKQWCASKRKPPLVCGQIHDYDFVIFSL
jgi:hypothetical protein